ncbi:hypothetical protein [Lysobacter sp. CA199]|uniref:hypothetical protein n=1 Tax=Lysobacter sp. CA199 TaxID=3455608 RepID=UPI003F8D1760
MKLWKKIAIAVVALAGISFLVPDFQEESWSRDEEIVALKLNRSGDRLLLRTQRYDFEFVLPANRLNDLPPVVSQSQPHTTVDLKSIDLGEVRVDSAGAASASLAVNIGGYDVTAPKTESVLPQEGRRALADLGFIPSNGIVSGNFEPSLYMAWQADLKGRRYPANSRGEYQGVDLTPWPWGTNATIVDVIDDGTLARNRVLNTLLRPLTTVRNGIIMVVGVLLILVTGFRPGA